MDLITKKIEQAKEWATEHETELMFGGVFGAIILFEFMFYSAAFDRGADAAMKAVKLTWGETLEKCVENGSLVLMMPNESGKMVKTMDWYAWGKAAAKMLES